MVIVVGKVIREELNEVIHMLPRCLEEVTAQLPIDIGPASPLRVCWPLEQVAPNPVYQVPKFVSRIGSSCNVRSQVIRDVVFRNKIPKAISERVVHFLDLKHGSDRLVPEALGKPTHHNLIGEVG